AMGYKAGAAGREGAFAGQRRRKILCRKRLPVASAVYRDNQLKHALHRVAEGDAVLLVPERDGIKEGRGIIALELQLPRLAAIGRFVDAGSVAGAGAEQIGSGLSKRLDVAEVEFFGAGHGPHRPRLAAVGGSPKCALGAADPYDVRAHHAQTAEVGF